jgi:serine/threonine-protein kinase RsbW
VTQPSHGRASPGAHRPGPAGGPHRRLRLPFSPASVAEARHTVRDALRDDGVAGPVVDDVLLVLSELVGNAVRHARPVAEGALLVAWRVSGDQVEVGVTDGGATTRPDPLAAHESASSGRGLAIVRALTTSWRVEGDGTEGHTVWAVLDRRND